jgi:hypothetical protein
MTKFLRNYRIATLGVMTILVTGLMSSTPTIAAGGQEVPIVGPLPAGRVGLERGRNPYMIEVHCEVASGNSCVATTPPVPVGKRLILERINSTAQLRDPAVVANWLVSVGTGDTNVMAALIPNLVVDDPPFSNFAANESVLIFVEAGQSIAAELNATKSGVTMDMLLSGYILDLSP